MANKLSIDSAYNLAFTTAKALTTKFPYYNGINFVEFAKVALTIMHIETGGKFNPDAYNKKSGSSGIMQIKPATKREVETKYLKTDVADDNMLFDAEYNSYCGLGYLGYQYKRYSRNWSDAVLAFNQGNASEKARQKAEGVKYLKIYYSLLNQLPFDSLENKYASLLTSEPSEFL